MAYKQMKLRNSGTTLTGLVLTLLIVIGMFFAGYTYISEHGRDAGVTVDDKYEDIYNELEESSSELNNTANAIKDNVDEIKEATSTFQVAWNGLKGLGNTLKLPIQFVTTTIAVWAASVSFTDFLPSWFLPLASIGLVIFVVFLILRVLKGEPAV